MRKNEKILIIGALPDYQRKIFGGTTVLMQNFLNYLDAHGLPYTFVRTNRYRDKSGNYRRILNKIVFLLQFICTLPFHKVVMFNFSNNGTANMFPFLTRISFAMGKKVVLRKFAGSLEDYLPLISASKQQKMKDAISKTNLVLFETKSGIEHLHSFIPVTIGRTMWFPNVRMQSKLKKNPNEFNKRLVFFGHVRVEKGIEELIALAGILPKDYSIELYGRIKSDKYVNFDWAAKGLQYKGEVAAERVLEILSEAMLLILPSHREGYPGVIIEAFSVGLPVVATRVGGIPEIVQDGNNGRLCEVGDVESLREAVLSFNPQNYKQYCANAKRSFDGNFNAATVNDQIYHRIMNL